ncbi:hypothetical protein ACU6T3_11850, partial [Avibacterium paragallinarum]|uniref:hypothetical protein n=1 Tax=Avibacterium paragallinarum TaxID=728 RepID=UPI00406BF2D2
NIPLSYQEILEYLSSIESVLLDGNIELKDTLKNKELLGNSLEQDKNLLITDPPKPIKVKSLLTTILTQLVMALVQQYRQRDQID